MEVWVQHISLTNLLFNVYGSINIFYETVLCTDEAECEGAGK